MKAEASRVLVIANTHKPGAAQLADQIISLLQAEGRSAQLFSFNGRPERQPDLAGIDLVLTLGGDGTVLYSARLAAPAGIPLLPLNLGRLGFIAWVQSDQWRRCLAEVEAGSLTLTRRIMLSIEVFRDGQGIRSFLAFNDGVISGAGPAKLINLSIALNGASLGAYRSDGVIIATPTGSTAYSMAAGGPIVDPAMAAMVFTPICPFTLSNRPLVLPSQDQLTVHVDREQRENIVLTVDGQDFFDLREGDSLLFSESAHRVQIYGPRRGGFFEVLRAKLNWSGGPDA